MTKNSLKSITLKRPLLLVAFICLIALLAACSREEPEQPVVTPPASTEQDLPIKQGCQGCHQVRLDENHNFACSGCHQGTEQGQGKDEAHVGLVSAPARSERMTEFCGSCHGRLTDASKATKHFSLADEINLVRQSFGANHDLSDPNAIPENEPPETVQDLADDMLRRRCLRCHP